jgi:hypothetical protein
MLPAELQATVQKVEQLAGCAIEVVPDETASEFDNLTFGVVEGVCRATIAYRGERISRCALLHEVLHLKRYWLNAVPMLRPATRLRYGFEAQMVEELVEHLIIIPEERQFVEAESNAHWSSVMANLIKKVDASKLSLVLQRAMMDIALPGLDHTRLYDRLRDENLLDSSAAFIDHLRNTLNDKERALISVIQEFRYDVTAFRVGRFNIRDFPKSIELSPLK